MDARVNPKDLGDALTATTPVTVIDVRGPRDFATGHVPGAINIPMAKLPGALRKRARDTEIVTYCNMHHPGESRGERAQALLLEKGYPAHVLEGGFPAWVAAGLPVEQG